MNTIKYLTSPKYRMFAKKMRDVQMSIWEMDFKIAKSRQIRESVRQDRDRCVEALGQITPAYEVEKDEAKKTELGKEKGLTEDTIRRYEAQMRMVDEQINGVPAEGENPGSEGIMDRIKALAELREMYKNYLTQI